jgi:peptidoglycan glycosyltransferase
VLVAASLGLSAAASVERGRERLLAGETHAAQVAFRRALRWPGTRTRAESGLTLARALRGGSPDGRLALADIRPFELAALLDRALEREDLRGARATAELLLRAGHPLGPLYAGAVALERGEADEARSLAAASPVPLASRALGRRLAEALALRASGASAIVRDRRGTLVGALDAKGRLTLAEGLDPLLLPPFREAAPRGRRVAAEPEAAVPFWLPPAEARAATRTGGLRLALDLDLARVALDALGTWRGTIVLVEPRTGSVLAAVSDPRTLAREGAAAFRQRREPASISKVITAAAAYRSGIDANAAIGHMTCRGVERFGGRPLWCTWKAGPLEGLSHAMAISCNIAFARLGVRIGRDRLIDELRRWGFDAGEDALMGAAGHIHTLPHNARQLADLSIGLTLSDITPLHAALLATVLANGGTMPEPRVVANPCGPVGLSDRVAVLPPPRKVLGPRTVPPLRRALQAVALYGTGTGLAPRGFPIAMKTGTAAEYRKGYHVNYIGIAPTPDAAVAFCVRITYRPNSRAVNQAAREVTSALLAGLAERRLSLQREARRQRAHAAWPTGRGAAAPSGGAEPARGRGEREAPSR